MLVDERVWPEMRRKCREEAEGWWGFADMKVVLLWELCMWVKGACTRCIQLWNHETNPTNCRKNESKKHRPWSQAELRRLGRRQQHKVYCGSRTEHETTEGTAPTHSALSPAHKQWICYRRFMTYTGQPAVPSVPLTLLAGRQEEHPACKNWMKRCWCGYRPAARCRLFAYGPADTIAITKPHHLLPYWCSSSSSSKQDYQHPQLETGAFCWSKGLWFLWITWRLWHMCGMTNKQGMQVSCLAAYVMPCTGEPGRKVRYKSLNCTDHILDASPDAQQTKVTIMR